MIEIILFIFGAIVGYSITPLIRIAKVLNHERKIARLLSESSPQDDEDVAD